MFPAPKMLATEGMLAVAAEALAPRVEARPERAFRDDCVVAVERLEGLGSVAVYA